MRVLLAALVVAIAAAAVFAGLYFTQTPTTKTVVVTDGSVRRAAAVRPHPVARPQGRPLRAAVRPGSVHERRHREHRRRRGWGDRARRRDAERQLRRRREPPDVPLSRPAVHPGPRAHAEVERERNPDHGRPAGAARRGQDPGEAVRASRHRRSGCASTWTPPARSSSSTTRRMRLSRRRLRAPAPGCRSWRTPLARRRCPRARRSAGGSSSRRSRRRPRRSSSPPSSARRTRW